MKRTRVAGLECLARAQLARNWTGSSARAALTAVLGQIDVNGTDQRAYVPATRSLAKHP